MADNNLEFVDFLNTVKGTEKQKKANILATTYIDLEKLKECLKKHPEYVTAGTIRFTTRYSQKKGTNYLVLEKVKENQTNNSAQQNEMPIVDDLPF